MSLFKRRRFPVEVILLCVRWYCKYGISYRDLAELMSERIVAQAMDRVADMERKIQDLKITRIEIRNKLTSTLDTFEQMVALDADQEANELPITQLYRKTHNE